MSKARRRRKIAARRGWADPIKDAARAAEVLRTRSHHPDVARQIETDRIAAIDATYTQEELALERMIREKLEGSR